MRNVEAILEARAATIAYEVIVSDLQNRIATLIRRANATDLKPNVLVTHGASIYAEILGAAEEAQADLVIVGSHRPAMKDYLLGTNAARVGATPAARFSSPGIERGRRLRGYSRPFREGSRRAP